MQTFAQNKTVLLIVLSHSKNASYWSKLSVFHDSFAFTATFKQAQGWTNSSLIQKLVALTTELGGKGTVLPQGSVIKTGLLTSTHEMWHSKHRAWSSGSNQSRPVCLVSTACSAPSANGVRNWIQMPANWQHQFCLIPCASLCPNAAHERHYIYSSVSWAIFLDFLDSIVHFIDLE